MTGATGTRVATARGAVWQAQLGLRRAMADLRRTVPHTTGSPKDCGLCNALDVLHDAEREIDARRADL